MYGPQGSSRQYQQQPANQGAHSHTASSDYRQSRPPNQQHRPRQPEYAQPHDPYGEAQPSAQPRPAPAMEATQPPAPPREAHAQVSMRANAPMGVADHHLGRPHDDYFRQFQGRDGRSLFVDRQETPGAQPGSGVIVTKQDHMMHDVLVLENVRQLRANASLLGIGSASINPKTDRRYAVYRAWQITEIHEIDDTREQRPAPPGATWYLARIHYGYAYQVVFTGNKRSFHAGVKAKFLSASGGIERFASENKLEMKVIGSGLQPDGKAIFAKTPDQITQHYKARSSPSPIFVEYRLIPGATMPPDESLTWEEEPEFTAGRYKVTSIQIWVGPRSGGLSWDVGGGAPDPMVDVYIGKERFYSCRERDVPVGQPMICNPDKTVIVSPESFIAVSVVDKDLAEHDVIGSAYMYFSAGKPYVDLEMNVKGDLNKATVRLEGPLN